MQSRVNSPLTLSRRSKNTKSLVNSTSSVLLSRMTPLEEMKKNLIGRRSDIPFDEDDSATANWNDTVVSGHVVVNDKPWCSGVIKEGISNGSRYKKGSTSSARRPCHWH